MSSLLQPVEREKEELSDSELLALSVKRPSVFVEFVARWRPRLFARAARAMGTNDDAEDVVQETFVRLYKYANRYYAKEGSDFSSWIYTIFYNVVKTAQSRRSRRSVFVSASQLDDDGEMVSVGAADQGFLERLLDIDQAASVLARLPATVASLLRHHVLEGRTYEELAKDEGVSVGAIRVRLYRARRSFQETMLSQQVGSESIKS
jgi:RNA polymerase sigma-70 factor, ECF subfamily